MCPPFYLSSNVKHVSVVNIQTNCVSQNTRVYKYKIHSIHLPEGKEMIALHFIGCYKLSRVNKGRKSIQEYINMLYVSPQPSWWCCELKGNNTFEGI